MILKIYSTKYPFIELKGVYVPQYKNFIIYDKNPKVSEELEIFYDCLQRLYKATGFRQIGDSKLEDFVDGDNGDFVTLHIGELKLFKVSNIEYKNLIKSVLVTNTPQNKELTKKFL